MVRGVHREPAVLSPRSASLRDNADAEAFFESTKTEPWMRDAPWGLRTKTTEPQTVLQIGHKIPKAWYRHDDEAEIRKCWSRANLFAQCAVENHDNADRNLISARGVDGAQGRLAQAVRRHVRRGGVAVGGSQRRQRHAQGGALRRPRRRRRPRRPRAALRGRRT